MELPTFKFGNFFTKSSRDIVKDKISQSLLNQLPFISGLLFIENDYLKYYSIITVIFLFVSFGNLGIEKLFAQKDLDVRRSFKTLLLTRSLSTILFLLIVPSFIGMPIVILYCSAVVVLFNVSILTEYLFVGEHLRKPIFTVKLFLVFFGIILRYFFRDLSAHLICLSVESVVLFLITILLIDNRKNNSYKVKEIKLSNYLESFILLISSFLVTKIYIFQTASLSDINLKFIHYFDYLIVFSGLIGNLMIRANLVLRDKLIFAFLITVLLIFGISLFVNSDVLYYIGAKVLSAMNVLIVYLVLSGINTRMALFMNIGSFLIMITFYVCTLFNLQVNIFFTMLLAEASVIPLFFIRKKLWSY